MTPREHVSFASREIWITDHRIQVAGWYFWLRDIRKVSVKALDYRPWLWRWISMSWLVILFLILGMRFISLDNVENPLDLPALDSPGDYAFWGLVLLLIAGMAVSLFIAPKAPEGVVFIVRMHQRFFRIFNIFASTDKERAESIAGEIEAAIAVDKSDTASGNDSYALSEFLRTSGDTRRSDRPPVIVGDLLVAGDKSYRVAETQSVRLEPMVPDYISRLVPYGAVIMFSLLGQDAARRYGGVFSTLSCITGIALIVALIWSFGYGGPRQQQTLYLVSALGTFGNVILFASMDRTEAISVISEVEGAIQGTISPHPQSSPTR